MAEVTRATTGLSSISSKKLPSFSNNGFPPSSSSSSKHIYDDVFGSQPLSKLKSGNLSSFGDDDYAEIFGSSKSENGGPWQSSCSSIPTLDLPVFEQRGRGLKGEIDYSGVFGDGGFDVKMDGHDLFDQLKKKAKTSSSATLQRSKGKPTEAAKSHIPSQSQSSRAPTNGFYKSFDSVNHLEHNNRASEINGAAHVAHVHAIHRSTCSLPEVSPPQKTQISRTPLVKDDSELGMDVYLTSKGKHFRNTSSDLGVSEQKSEHDTGSQKASGLSESNSAAIHQSTYSLPEVGPSQKAQISRTPVVEDDSELGMDVYLAKKGKHSRNTSLDLGAKEHKSEQDTGSQKASGLRESNSASIHQSTSSLPEAGLSQKTQISTPVVKDDTELGDVYLSKSGNHSRSTSSDLGAKKQKSEHDSGSQKASGMRESNSAAIHRSTYSLPEFGPSQKAHISRAPVVKDDTELGDVYLSKAGKDSRNASLDIGAKEQKSEDDIDYQKASGLGESNSVATSLATPQASTLAGPSKVVKDDARLEPNVKDDIAVVGPSDLSANKQNSENDAAFQNASGLTGSDSVAISQDTCQASSIPVSQKVIPDDAKVSTSFVLEKKKKGRHSRITSLDLGDSKQACERDAGFQRKSRLGVSYSFDASHDPFAARIKVQPSKVVPSSSLPQFFPVESHCKISENSSCKSSEDNLRRGAEGSPPSLFEQLDENSAAAVSAAALQRAIEEAEMKIRLAKEFLEREGQGSTKLSFKDTLKAISVKEYQHANNISELSQKNKHGNRPRVDRVIQTCSHSERERNSVLGTARSVPVLDDQMKFPKDEPEEPIDMEITKASKSIEEDDKREGGGEWEAAKHLNQLISGVKNKLASFMTWQAETEKKEEPKEMDVSRNWLRKSGEGEEESKETEENQCAAMFAGETSPGENKKGIIAEATELEENELMKANTMEQEKAGERVDLIPGAEGPTRTNFLFFSFSREKSWESPVPEGKEKSQETGDLGIENRQEQVIDKVSDKLIEDKGKGEDANRERSDEISMSEDLKKSLTGSSDEESDERSDEIVEEPYSMAGDDIRQFTDEEENHVGLHEEHGDDRSKSALEENDDIMVDKESGDDIDKSTNEEESDVRLNEEHSDDKNNSTHEEDCDRGLNEEHGDDKDTHVFTDEEYCDRRLNEELGDEQIENPLFPENTIERFDEVDECEIYEEVEEAEDQQDDTQVLQEADLVGERAKPAEASGELFGEQDDEKDQGTADHIELVVGEMNEWEDNEGDQDQTNHAEKTVQEVTEQASYIAEVTEQASYIAADFDCKQTETVSLSAAEEACTSGGGNAGVNEAAFPDEESEKMELNNFSSEPEMDSENTVFPVEECEMTVEVTDVSSNSKPEMDLEHPVCVEEARESIGEEGVLASFPAENAMEVDGVEYLDCTNGTLPGNFVLHESENDVSLCGQNDIDEKAMESVSEEILENQAEHLHDSVETMNVEEAALIGDPEEEKSSVEAVHRRRWFENEEKVGAAEPPSFLEKDITNVEIDQEVLEESELAGSVQIHDDKLCSEATEVRTSSEADTVLNQEDSRINVEATHKRRRWFVNRGEQGVPEPPSLFDGVKVNLGMDSEFVSESISHNLSDDSTGKFNSIPENSFNVAEADMVGDGEKVKQNADAAPRRKRWFESGEKVVPGPQLRSNEDAGRTVDNNQEQNVRGDADTCSPVGNMPILEEKDVHDKVETVNRDQDAVNRRKKEKKERIAVERAIREARERAFAEARERARRDAVERPNVDAHQKIGSGAQDNQGKVSAEASSSSDKASMEAKLRAERAAVERATLEARERALQKALSEKDSRRSGEQAGRQPAEKNSSLDPKYHSSSSYSRCSDSANKGENFDGAEGESAQRRKARLDRQNRSMERATQALEEKNKRDLLAQKEQAARNMLADTLDAEVKRWSNGKEGNLRALLSTLQYILGSDSGWQAVALTDLVAPTAVRKAYKKATLCVHPDKLQQRGATIQQKYICEKVFDLLKEAWSKFNPEER